MCLSGFIVLVSAHAFISGARSQEDDSRQIVPEEFTKARPAKSQPTANQQRPPAAPSKPRQRRDTSPSTTAVDKRRYRRRTKTTSSSSSLATSSAAPHTPKSSIISAVAAKVGVTIWRLRPAQQTDEGARILVQGDANEWIPERIGATTELQVRDRVRLTIESPREGYLYVVDRELYENGSMGDPYLIFPTTRTRGGDNRVRPGKLIDIPAQEDTPNYFSLIPSPGREDQRGEILTIIVTAEPLENFEPPSRPLKLLPDQVQRWERMWGGAMEQYDLEGGAGQTWTQAEREASKVGSYSRYLTQEDPSPQTIYLVEGKNNKGLLITVPLKYKR